MSYLDALSRELAAHGIRGRTRKRILLEVEDHLRSDQDAEARFGSASEVAHAFAAELGAQASRRAAVDAFAALAVAGAVYAVSFVSLQFADAAPGELPASALTTLAFTTMIVAPQVAFVSGTLALVRALRRRTERVLPTSELVVIRRRSTVALASGLATMGALSLYGYQAGADVAAWWRSLTYASTTGAAVLLGLALVPTATAARLRTRVEGAAGDVFDDLGVERLRTDPWRFARPVAATIASLVWLAAAVQGDPLDGLLQGIVEGLACLGGFAALGRYLGLRR